MTSKNTQEDASAPRTCVIIGVGPGNGAALARRFSADGYRLALIARSQATMAKLSATLPDVHGYPCDVADAEALTRVMKQIESDLGPIDVLVYNAGKGVWGTAEEIDVARFEEAWRINTLGAFVASRSVLEGMKTRGSGAIIFIGATASRRGTAKATAFASAKSGQRALAESLARAYWPAGIHVALIVVDGVVDEPLMRARLSEKPEEFFVSPNGIARIAGELVLQTPSAWSFEVEARPFGESW